MANVKITDLAADTNPASTDVLPFVDISADETKKVTIADLLENAGDGSASAPAFAFDDDSNTGIYRPGADQLAISTGGTGRLFIDSSGNVGIGTTSPSNLLHLNHSSDVAIRLDRGGTKQLNIGTDSSQSFVASFESKPLAFATSTSSAYVERMRIDSSGNVGINGEATAASSTKTLQITDSVTARILLESTGTGGRKYGWYTSVDGQFAVFDYNANSERLRINSSGNLGIGDSNPDARCVVYRQTQFSGNSAFAVKTDAGSTKSTKFLVDGNGNVGVGVSSPRGNLHLHSSSATRVDLTNTATGTASGDGSTISIDGSTGALNIIQREAQPINFSTSNTPAAAIDSSGRLLVGTSSSSGVNATLQVIGDTAAQFHRGINAASGASIAISKSRNTTYGSNTIVQDDDLIGTVAFRADDGTDYHTTAAFIGCHVDGTPGANDMPGRLVFATTADGANSSTERLTILSDGNIVAPQVYASTTASAANVNVNSSGYLIRSISSIKFKKDIETIEDTYSDALLNCRPVWYRSKSEHDNQDWGYWGFIAEEVAEIDPRLVSWKTTETTYDEDGAAVQTACDPEPEGVQYDRFVPHLLNLIKRQQQTIEALEQRLTDAGL